MMTTVSGLHGIPRVAHADRGTSMTSKSMVQLLTTSTSPGPIPNPGCRTTAMIGGMPFRVGSDHSQRPTMCLRVDLSTRVRDGAWRTGQASSDLTGASPKSAVAALSARPSCDDHHHPLPRRRQPSPASRRTHPTVTARSDSHCTVGVDTGKDVHVAVALDQLGARLEEPHVPATAAGYAQLEEWVAGLGPVKVFGVEGTGSYGAELARLLAARGHLVVEVNRPDRAMRHRIGKSDPIDGGPIGALRRRDRHAQARRRERREGPHAQDGRGFPGQDAHTGRSTRPRCYWSETIDSDGMRLHQANAAAN